MEKIDDLDKKILEIISQNARTPFKDVAVECGVSRAAIHQRVQRLIDLGVIIGSGYYVNPKMLGFHTCTYVGLNLAKGSMYKEAIEELKKIPQIKEVRGKGLMIGMEFDEPIKEIRRRLLFEEHVFTGVSGTNVIRLLPPLTLTMEQAEEFIARFKRVLA